MVLLERLSNSNFENFKVLNLERFNTANFDKNFFEYYNNEKFLFKIILKKFVKLFIYNKEVIGYIWYEVPVEVPVRVLSLYVKPEYVELLTKDVLRSFDNTVLSYEACEDTLNNNMLKLLGFRKANPSVLMNMKLASYTKDAEIDKLLFDIKSGHKYKELINSYFNIYYDYIDISIDKVIIDSDEPLRCEIQNSIFSATSRIPLEIEDIQNDIEQDYYIEDLSLFLKINNIAVGYGQVIYTKNMYTVVNFGIISEFRGMGFGKILLNELILRAKALNICELYIRVEENNYKAMKLYDWIGFTPTSVVNRWER